MEERAKKIIDACLQEKSKLQSSEIECCFSDKNEHCIKEKCPFYKKTKKKVAPDPDVAISMGCNVGCPFIGRAFDDNWGLEDPTGKSDEEFKEIIKVIEDRILQLKNELM